jgi:hypothetical protein
MWYLFVNPIYWYVTIQIIVTFSCFEKKELIKYFFYILDARHTGLIEKVLLFIRVIYNVNVVRGSLIF